MKKYNTILELICAVAGWRCCSIQQALGYFERLTVTEQTAIYFACNEYGVILEPPFNRIYDIVKAGNIQRFNGMVKLCATS